MAAPTTQFATDRLDDDGSPVRVEPSGADSRVRLVWAPAADGRNPAGAWWPRTRDAVAELIELLPLVGARMGGPVTRVSLNIDSWGPEQPRRLNTPDRVVRLGWFHTLDPMTITLGRGTFDRITLAVLPPDIEPATGRRLLERHGIGATGV